MDHPPTLKLNSFVKPHNYMVSKTIMLYYVSVLAIFSLNFGFIRFKSSKSKFLLPIVCICQISAVSFFIVYYFVIYIDSTVMRCWYFMYLLKYWALSLGTQFIDKYTFFDFWKDLRAIYIELGDIQQFKRIGNIIITLTASNMLYRTFTSALYCNVFEDFCIPSKTALIFFQIPLTCVDIFLIMYFIIFYSIYRCMIKFITIVKADRRSIYSANHMYKIMCDVTENGKRYFDYLFLFALVFHTVDVLLTVFLPLIDNEQQTSNPIQIVVANVSLVQVLLLVFSPAFAAGILTGKAEELMLVLHDKLLVAKDYRHMRDIEKFIKYLEVRPLKFTICRVIPLDWKLPVIILDLCVTYLIVMLQLTHKY